jgi:hypothetical protein
MPVGKSLVHLDQQARALFWSELKMRSGLLTLFKGDCGAKANQFIVLFGSDPLAYLLEIFFAMKEAKKRQVQ